MVAYATLRLPLPSVGEHAGTLMAIMGLLAVLWYGKGVRSSAPLWLLLAVVLVQLVSWVFGYWHHPEWMTSNPQLDRLAKLFVFISVAWWLSGSTRYTLGFWSICLAGFFLTTFLPGSIHDWTRGVLQGGRVDFGIHNAQHTAMYFGTSFLGLLAFTGRIFALPKWRIFGVIIWSIALILSFIGLVITKTRAAWLAVLVASVLMLIVCLWYLIIKERRRQVNYTRLVSAGLVISVIVAFAWHFFEPGISKRVFTESETVNLVLKGDLSKVPYSSSVGVRVHSWLAAGDWISERPLVGWGEKGRSLVMQHTEGFPERLNQFGHLHNSMLEIIVAYGLLGFSVFVTLFCWLVYRGWQAWRIGAMPGDVALFGLGFSIFWIIINQFESFMSFWTGVYLFNVVVGGLLTYIWASIYGQSVEAGDSKLA